MITVRLNYVPLFNYKFPTLRHGHNKIYIAWLSWLLIISRFER